MNTPRTDLTAERLREALTYHPDEGYFVWRIKRPGLQRADGLAGTLRKTGLAVGRRVISIDAKPYFAYRLAWLYMTGEWPQGEIDHIDGDPGNDRWSNLRVVTHAENMQNRRKAHAQSRTGVQGVYPSGKRFVTGISVNGKIIWLGTYETAEEAHQVFLAAKRQHHAACTI